MDVLRRIYFVWQRRRASQFIGSIGFINGIECLRQYRSAMQLVRYKLSLMRYDPTRLGLGKSAELHIAHDVQQPTVTLWHRRQQHLPIKFIQQFSGVKPADQFIRRAQLVGRIQFIQQFPIRPVGTGRYRELRCRLFCA